MITRSSLSIKTAHFWLVFTIVVALLIGVGMYIQHKAPKTYPRLELPDELTEFSMRQYQDNDDFGAYIYEFTQIMFPAYDINKIERIESPRDSCLEQDEDMCFVVSYSPNTTGFAEAAVLFIYLDGFQIFDMYFYNATFLTSNNEGRVLENNQMIQHELTKEVCGPLANDKTCGVYRNSNDNVCYMSAINTYFAANKLLASYCPDDKEFTTSKEQLTAYIFDGFMSLNIPDEFSLEYLESR